MCRLGRRLNFDPDSELAIFSVIAILGYYWFAARRVVDLGARLTKHIPFLRDFAYTEAESMVRLAVAGISQCAFCVGIIWVAGLRISDLGFRGCPAVLVLYGVLLGIGEMALSSFLGFVATRFIAVVEADPTRQGVEAWVDMSRSGWMRHYLRTVECAPWPIASGLVLLYVSVEEIVFRPVVLHLWMDSPVLALVISTALFSLVQVFNMPSWRHGLFPFVGAATMGVIHGILFLQRPFIIPLIMAHLAFFGTAIMIRRESPETER